MIGVILDDLAVQKDLPNGLIGYLFRHHLLVTVNRHANVVRAGLLLKSSHNLFRVAPSCICHMKILLL